MIIYIKYEGKPRLFDVSSSDTIHSLKIKINNILNTGMPQFTLYYPDRLDHSKLADCFTVGHYNIVDKDSIYMKRTKGYHFFPFFHHLLDTRPPEQISSLLMKYHTALDIEKNNQEVYSTNEVVQTMTNKIISNSEKFKGLRLLDNTNAEAMKDIIQHFDNNKYNNFFDEALSHPKALRLASQQGTLMLFDGVKFIYHSTSDEIKRVVESSLYDNNEGSSMTFLFDFFVHYFPVDGDNGRPEKHDSKSDELNQTFLTIERVVLPGFKSFVHQSGVKCCIAMLILDAAPIVMAPNALSLETGVPSFLEYVVKDSLANIDNVAKKYDIATYTMSSTIKKFNKNDDSNILKVDLFSNSLSFTSKDNRIHIFGKHFSSKLHIEEIAELQLLFACATLRQGDDDNHL